MSEKRIERLLRLISVEKQNVTDRDHKLEAIKAWAESKYTKFTKDDLWKLGPPNYGTKRTLEELMKILEGGV